MSEMSKVKSNSNILFHSFGTEPTELGGMDVDEVIDTPPVVAPAPSAIMIPVPAAAQQKLNRFATVEHLAARRNLPELSENAPEVKQTMSVFRTELTLLLTDLRWGGQSAKDTADQIIPLLNVGPLQQWIPVLIPNIWEIDRAGDFIPAWLSIIGQEDPVDLPLDANPAETMIGRARRIALLMLGFYKSADISEVLGKLSTDPGSSLYATRSLIKQSTVAAMKALASALKEAEGWAKVDVIDAFATLNQTRFYDIMLLSGLDYANGLESYIAVPLYRTLPLENYLRGESNIAPRLTQQSALVVNQIVLDSMSYSGNNSLPLIFERNLSTLTSALFDGAKNTLQWQSVIALHRLGLLLGRYWGDISRNAIQDQRIVQPVYASLPMMPDIERWMNDTGRDVLWKGLNNQEEAFMPCLKVLSELRDARVSQALINRLDTIMHIADREQASLIGQMCDTLVQLKETRAISSIRELVKRTIPVDTRNMRDKRRDNLESGDAEIPGSIVYGAAIRTFAQFGDPSTLDFILQAANDFDPYIRVQALEALKSLDPKGEEDPRTRTVVREALNDPRDTVVRVACQLITRYHDVESITALHHLAETRAEFASSVQEALRQLI